MRTAATLGKIGPEATAAAPALADALADENEFVRSGACAAVAKLGKGAAATALINVLAGKNQDAQGSGRRRTWEDRLGSEDGRPCLGRGVEQ